MKSPSYECSTSATNGNGHSGSHRPHSLHHNKAVTELNCLQLDRLVSVLSEPVEIHGRENFPTLEVQLYRLIARVKRKLHEAGLQLGPVKMNGGAASYVLAAADDFAYSDLDLIFPISLADEHAFDHVRAAVFAALLELMPDTANTAMICADTLKDVYIRKMVKVSDSDRWSLFSLHNDYGRCIELKFVDKMRRQFEFSVDSFQISLDPLLDFLNADGGFAEGRPLPKTIAIKAESMYGNVLEALAHLNKQLIDTRHPEEIRGGGLLKYCHLLSRSYLPTVNCRNMEKYMCSRFFIDFPDVNVQENKLRAYLDNHFGNEDELKLDYLQILYKVIRESSLCLMGHERRLTLQMVDQLRQVLTYELYYGGCCEANGSYTHSRVAYYRPYSSHVPVHYKNHNQQRSSGAKPRKQRQYSGIPVAYPYNGATTPQFDSVSITGSLTSTGSTEIESTPACSSTNGSEAESRASSQQSNPTTHTPRQTLLYLPPNATRWVQVA